MHWDAARLAMQAWVREEGSGSRKLQKHTCVAIPAAECWHACAEHNVNALLMPVSFAQSMAPKHLPQHSQLACLHHVIIALLKYACTPYLAPSETPC